MGPLLPLNGMVLSVLVPILIASSFGAVLADSATSVFRVMLPNPLAKSLPRQIPHHLTLYENPRTTGVSGPIDYFATSLDDPCQLDLNRAMSSRFPTIALIDRTRSQGCELSQFVLELQRSEVQLVLVGDDLCQCESGKDSPPVDFVTQCSDLAKLNPDRLTAGSGCDRGFEVILEYDSIFSLLRIPVVQVDWVTAEKIKNCLKGIPSSGCVERSVVVGTFQWGLRVPRVSIDLWGSPESEWIFKKSFAPFATKLDNFIDFRPRYLVYRGADWGCHVDGNKTTDPFCNIGCIDNVYCSKGSMVVTGKAVLEETLRQLCIYKVAAKTSSAASSWWRYVSKFATDCNVGGFTKQCSDSIQTQIQGLSPQATETCIRESWKNATYNSLLEDEATTRIRLNLIQLPALIVSGLVIRGAAASPTVRSMLTLICDRLERPSHLCSCLSLDPTALVDCMSSTCVQGELFCEKTKTCYPRDREEQYMIDCTLCVPGTAYCPSLGRCAPTCPQCPDPSKRFYCIPSESCVPNPSECVIPPGSRGGMSVTGIVAVTLLVVFMVGSVGFAWWKRQRAQFRSEVTETMERYLPLEEQRKRGVARPNRVEPSLRDSPSSPGSSSALMET